MPKAALVPIAAVAVAGAAIGLSSASAQGPGPRTLTFKELNRGATFVHIRNTRHAPRRANSLGDLIVFTNPVVDPGGARVGRTHITCTTTVGARKFTRSTVTCTGVMALRDGTLAITANVKLDGSPTTGAVTGGTGAYANARGVIVSRQTQDGSEDTITLTS